MSSTTAAASCSNATATAASDSDPNPKLTIKQILSAMDYLEGIITVHLLWNFFTFCKRCCSCNCKCACCDDQQFDSDQPTDPTASPTSPNSNQQVRIPERLSLWQIVKQSDEPNAEIEIEWSFLMIFVPLVITMVATLSTLCQAMANSAVGEYAYCCVGSGVCSQDYCYKLPIESNMGSNFTAYFIGNQGNPENTWGLAGYTNYDGEQGVCGVQPKLNSNFSHSTSVTVCVIVVSIVVTAAYAYMISLYSTSAPFRILLRQLKERVPSFPPTVIIKHYYFRNIVLLFSISVLGILAVIIVVIAEIARGLTLHVYAYSCKGQHKIFVPYVVAHYEVKDSDTKLSIITTCVSIVFSSATFLYALYRMYNNLLQPLFLVKATTLHDTVPGLVTRMSQDVVSLNHAAAATKAKSTSLLKRFQSMLVCDRNSTAAAEATAAEQVYMETSKQHIERIEKQAVAEPWCKYLLKLAPIEQIGWSKCRLIWARLVHFLLCFVPIGIIWGPVIAFYYIYLRIDMSIPGTGK